MANEYFVNSADMTAVADAIREKGGTEDALVFPSGFVSAIENIIGGLNFEVIGGTTQPSNPKENTIWVNTDTEITSWSINTQQPTGAIGKVWIGASTTSNVSFNAIKENEIQVHALRVSQYVNNAWASKDAYIYHNGAWEKLGAYLYYKGDPCNSLSGGYVAVAWKFDSGNNAVVPTVTNYGDSTNISLPNSGYTGGAYITYNDIDLTNYSRLIFSITGLEFSSTHAIDRFSVGVIAPRANEYADVIAAVRGNSITTGLITIDVSGLTGSYPIGFLLYAHYGACSVTFDQIWLE